MVRLILKLFGLIFGLTGLVDACSAENRDAVKSYMKAYLQEKTTKEFEEVEFYNTMSTSSSRVNEYYGLWRAVDDPRIEINMMASINFKTKEVSLIKPDGVDERIEQAVRCAALSSQLETLVQKYVKAVFVQAKGSATSYRININVEDKIEPSLGKKYIHIAQQIAKDIRAQILDESIYFVLDFYIFGKKFPFKKVMYQQGVSGNEPVGDFHINVHPKKDFPFKASVGISSDLDHDLRNKVYKDVQRKFDVMVKKEDVSLDMGFRIDFFPEDLNADGLREYMRYFVAVWDEDRKNVIDRKFAKIHVFTKEIEWYEVKEFPRPIPKKN